MKDANRFVECVLDNLPSSDRYQTKLHGQLCTDSVCTQVMKFCLEGWPDRNQLQGPVRQHWQDRAVLSVHDGLLLRGTRLVIRAIMRNDVLEKIHKGHVKGGKVPRTCLSDCVVAWPKQSDRGACLQMQSMHQREIKL